MLLVQIGGLGIMTLGLAARASSSCGALGLRGRLIAQAETGALGLGDVRRIVRDVVALHLALRGCLRRR